MANVHHADRSGSGLSLLEIRTGAATDLSSQGRAERRPSVYHRIGVPGCPGYSTKTQKSRGLRELGLTQKNFFRSTTDYRKFPPERRANAPCSKVNGGRAETQAALPIFADLRSPRRGPKINKLKECSATGEK